MFGRIFKNFGGFGASVGARIGGGIFCFGYFLLVVIGFLGVAALIYSLT